MKWPEPKKHDRDCRPWLGIHGCTCGASHWNSCRAEFMKIIESQEDETANDIAFQKGYAAGFKAQPKPDLVPMDVEKMLKDAIDYHAYLETKLDHSQIIGLKHFLIYLCNKYGATPAKVMTVREILDLIHEYQNKTYETADEELANAIFDRMREGDAK